MRCAKTGRLVLFSLLVPAQAWAQPYGFVTSGGSDSVAILDLASDALIGSYPMAGLPSGAALTSNGVLLYVALTQANALATINMVTGATTSTGLPATPTGVVADGPFAYVASTGADRISVYSALNQTVQQTVPAGGSPFALALGAGTLYVANCRPGRVAVFSTQPSLQFVAFVPVGRTPLGLALDTAASRLYVANFLDDTVSVVDTVALAVVATIPVVERPRGLALDASAGRLYVAGFQNGDIQVIDTATNQVVQQASTGGANPVDVALGPGASRLYVVHVRLGKSVTVLDAATLAPLTAIEAPLGPLTFAGFGPHLAPVPERRPVAAVPATRRPSRPWPGVVTRSPAASRGTAPWELLDGQMFFWEDLPGSGSQFSNYMSSGGNPGEWQRTVHAGSGSGDHVHSFVEYTPRWDGAIEAIDVTWDRRAQAETGSFSDRFVVLQGGRIYRSSPEAVVPTGWEQASRVGITLKDLQDDRGGHPNFSLFGERILFGYAVRYDGTETAEYGADNFHVVAHRLPLPYSNGILGFADVIGDIAAGEFYTATARRSEGTDGDVGAGVRLTCRSWTAFPTAAQWADGDASNKPIQVACLTGPEEGFEAQEVYLHDPTGGAVLHPYDDRFSLFVRPEPLPEELALLLHTLETLASGFSPFWILGLAVPTALLLARRA